MLLMNIPAMAIWQDAGSMHDMASLRTAVWIIAIALLVQAACVLIGVFIAASFGAKLFFKLDSMSNNLEQKTGPILVRTHDLLRDLTPKIHTIGTNIEQISYTVRARTDELGATVSELNETISELNGRTLRQVRRADAIVTEALVATEEISQTVQQGIRMPVRQIVGIIAGVQAAVETFIRRGPFGRR